MPNVEMKFRQISWKEFREKNFRFKYLIEWIDVFFYSVELEHQRNNIEEQWATRVKWV